MEERKIVAANDELGIPIKEVPNNVEAEKGLIGALLNNNEGLNKIADFLLHEHFYVPLHKKIYQAIIKFSEQGMVANPITLKNYFESDESLLEAKVSSFDYLVKLSANAGTVFNVESFAKIIYDNYIRRKLINIGEETMQDCYEDNPNEQYNHKIERAEQKLFNLAIAGNAEKKAVRLKDSLNSMLAKVANSLKKGAKAYGVTTGLLELDQLLGGMQPSDLIILAARPSMGKTSLATNIATSAAERFLKDEPSNPKSTAFFSLEMSAEQLATRILSIKTKISSNKIRMADMEENEFQKLSSNSDNLGSMPLFIDDTPALSISALRTRARRLKRQHNLGLIVVDYLQLLAGSRNTENRVNEIGEISQGLKALAKELDIPVIALSQLSRAVETREDKRPQLSDLRESGNIEQDADVVMFIYREQYYLERKRPIEDQEKDKEWQEKHDKVKNTAEIIVSKHRNGPIGIVSVMFNPETTEFANLDMVHRENV